ncbi:MAG: hypothetical protein PHC83_03330 [Bacteroidales bacterium]|nr:hypothetical protein [Bacteroidales bacterium]
MKRILFFLLVIASYCVIAQSNKVDTISIQYEKFKSVNNLKHDNKFVFKKNQRYYLVKKAIRKYYLIDTINLDSFFDTSNFYCRFYYKNKIIEEGIWDFYFYSGYYRSYFKNGKIKSEGNFNYSVEMSKWIYYKKDGSVYKIIYYPNDINEGLDREKGKVNIKKLIKYYTYTTPQDSINFVKSVKGIWLWRYR